MNIDINKYVPAFLAMVVALCITLLVRIILPSSEETSSPKSEELPLPEIPFTDKTIDKNNESFVLIASRNIRQWEQISSSDITWKKWPKEAISASFIAKDNKDNMLNDSGTYSSVINMFAKFPITKGIPITKDILARKHEEEKKNEHAVEYTGPSEAEIRANVERELSEKFKQEMRKAKIKEEEEKRKILELERNNRVKSGKGIVTVQIDQRSAPPAFFLKVGDYIDLKFLNRSNSNSDYIVYENLKVISINGSRENNTTLASVQNKFDEAVRTLVVEGSTEDIANILKQLEKTSTAILVVKNQEDAIKILTQKPKKKKKDFNKDMLNKIIAFNIRESDQKKKTDPAINTTELNRIVSLNNMTRPPRRKDKEVQKKQDLTEVQRIIKLNDMRANRYPRKDHIQSHISNSDFLRNLLKQAPALPAKKEETEKKKEVTDEIKVYKKFTESVIQFDENGEIIDAAKNATNKLPIIPNI